MAHNSFVRVGSWPFKVSLWRVRAWLERIKKVRIEGESKSERVKDWTDKGKENKGKRKRKRIEIESSKETFVVLVRGREGRKEKKGKQTNKQT